MPEVSEILTALGITCLLVSLVCHIRVVSAIFEKKQTVMGIVCTVAALAHGIGYLVAFVYGWIMAGEWKLKSVMLVWTGTTVVALICCGDELMLAGGDHSGNRVGASRTGLPYQLDHHIPIGNYSRGFLSGSESGEKSADMVRGGLNPGMTYWRLGEEFHAGSNAETLAGKHAIAALADLGIEEEQIAAWADMNDDELRSWMSMVEADSLSSQKRR